MAIVHITVVGSDKSCNCCNCCDKLSGKLKLTISAEVDTQCWTCSPETGEASYRLSRAITNPMPMLTFFGDPIPVGAFTIEEFQGSKSCEGEPGFTETQTVYVTDVECDFDNQEIRFKVGPSYTNVECLYTFDCKTLALKSSVCLGITGCPCRPCSVWGVSLSIA